MAPRICLHFMRAHRCACTLAVSGLRWRNVMLTSSYLLLDVLLPLIAFHTRCHLKRKHWHD